MIISTFNKLVIYRSDARTLLTLSSKGIGTDLDGCFGIGDGFGRPGSGPPGTDPGEPLPSPPGTDPGDLVPCPPFPLSLPKTRPVVISMAAGSASGIGSIPRPASGVAPFGAMLATAHAKVIDIASDAAESCNVL